ncbi:MAG: membrane protein insertase YidC [Candidatus Aminicenantia bacterium]
MEKRILLAIILSFLVLVLYQVFFVKKQPPPSEIIEKKGKVEKKTEEIKPPPRVEKIEKPVVEPSIGEQIVGEQIIGLEENKIIVETSLYRAIWTNRGGLLYSWKLKKHKDDNGGDLELVSEEAHQINKYPFYILTESDQYNQEINNALYHSPSRKISLRDGEKGSIKFIYSKGRDVKIEKIFNFEGGSYLVSSQINVWLNGRQVEPEILWGPSIRTLSEKERKQKFGGGKGIAVLVGNKVYRIKEEKFKLPEAFYLYPQWAAYEDNYFAALFLLDPNQSRVKYLKDVKENIPYYFLSVTHPEKMFLGPKEYNLLIRLGYQTKNLIKFGFFGWIAEILLRALQFIHKSIPNYGFSIIILTLIIKILFFPLTFSGSRSMAKMQELQPKIKALRARYKKVKTDIAQRRKLNEEMMKLYKEHGINPAGGCLPMLIQIPVFWGFFRLLMVSIEIRHSPFILWIKDLSVKDPYYVTPILMGISQYISQKMTPTTADPTQARMMMIMPVVMTLFFMNFQSGLVLYWLTSNVLQIGQQYIINKMIKKEKRKKDGRKKKKR